MELVFIILRTIMVVVIGFSLSTLFIRISPLIFNIDLVKEVQKSNVGASYFIIGIYLFVSILTGFLSLSALG